MGIAMDFTKEKEAFEKAFILKALEQFQGINKTVEGAGIPKKTLLRKIEKYGIDAKQYWSKSGARSEKSDELCG